MLQTKTPRYVIQLVIGFNYTNGLEYPHKHGTQWNMQAMSWVLKMTAYGKILKFVNLTGQQFYRCKSKGNKWYLMLFVS